MRDINKKLTDIKKGSEAIDILLKLRELFPQAFYWNPSQRTVEISTSAIKDELRDIIEWNQRHLKLASQSQSTEFEDNGNKIIIIGERHNKRGYLEKIGDFVNRENCEDLIFLLEEELDSYTEFLGDLTNYLGFVGGFEKRHCDNINKFFDKVDRPTFVTSSSLEQRVLRSIVEKDAVHYPLGKNIDDFFENISKYDAIIIDGIMFDREQYTVYLRNFEHKIINGLGAEGTASFVQRNPGIIATMYRNYHIYEKLKELNNDNKNKVIVVVAGAYHVVNQNVSKAYGGGYELCPDEKDYQAVGLCNLIDKKDVQFIIEEKALDGLLYHKGRNKVEILNSRQIIDVIKDSIDEVGKDVDSEAKSQSQNSLESVLEIGQPIICASKPIPVILKPGKPIIDEKRSVVAEKLQIRTLGETHE